MSRRSPPEWLPPPGQPIPGRRGLRGSYDPFYVFEKQAQPGKPAPPSKRELRLRAVLGSNAALWLVSGLLAFVVVAVLVLLAARA